MSGWASTNRSIFWGKIREKSGAPYGDLKRTMALKPSFNLLFSCLVKKCLVTRTSCFGGLL